MTLHWKNRKLLIWIISLIKHANQNRTGASFKTKPVLVSFECWKERLLDTQTGPVSKKLAVFLSLHWRFFRLWSSEASKCLELELTNAEVLDRVWKRWRLKVFEVSKDKQKKLSKISLAVALIRAANLELKWRKLFQSLSFFCLFCQRRCVLEMIFRNPKVQEIRRTRS